jgi:hypothetical protein
MIKKFLTCMSLVCGNFVAHAEVPTVPSATMRDEAERIQRVQHSFGASIEWTENSSSPSEKLIRLIRIPAIKGDIYNDHSYDYKIFVRIPEKTGEESWLLIGTLSKCIYTPSPRELYSVLTHLKGGRSNPNFTPNPRLLKPEGDKGLTSEIPHGPFPVKGGTGYFKIEKTGENYTLKAFRSNAGGKEKEITVGTLKSPLSTYALGRALEAISKGTTQSGKTPAQVAKSASNETFDVSPSLISTTSGVAIRGTFKLLSQSDSTVSDRQFVENLLSAFIKSVEGGMKKHSVDATHTGKTNKILAIEVLEKGLLQLNQGYYETAEKNYQSKPRETPESKAAGILWEALSLSEEDYAAACREAFNR